MNMESFITGVYLSFSGVCNYYSLFYVICLVFRVALDINPISQTYFVRKGLSVVVSCSVWDMRETDSLETCKGHVSEFDTKL
jgi:hypothetical protein